MEQDRDSNLKRSSEQQDPIKSEINMLESAVKHGRRSFLPDEAEYLIAFCEDEIKAGKISKIDIITKITNNPKGRAIYRNVKSRVRHRDAWKVICDRLRTAKRSKKESKKEFTGV